MDPPGLYRAPLFELKYLVSGKTHNQDETQSRVQELFETLVDLKCWMKDIMINFILKMGPNDPQAMVFNRLLEAMFNSMNGNKTKFYSRKGRIFDLKNNDDDKQRKKKEKNPLHLNLQSKNILHFNDIINQHLKWMAKKKGRR